MPMSLAHLGSPRAAGLQGAVNFRHRANTKEFKSPEFVSSRLGGHHRHTQRPRERQRERKTPIHAGGKQARNQASRQVLRQTIRQVARPTDADTGTMLVSAAILLAMTMTEKDRQPITNKEDYQELRETNKGKQT